MDFQLKWRFWGTKWGRGGAILTPNELVFTFGGSYVCANFGENRSRNATVRVPTNGHTDTMTDANWLYNPSHAICYSHGADVYTLAETESGHKVKSVAVKTENISRTVIYTYTYKHTNKL